MTPSERYYVWYRPAAEGQIEGVSTVLLPQLGILPATSVGQATEDRFGLQVLEVDAARYSDAIAMHEQFRVVDGALRKRG